MKTCTWVFYAATISSEIFFYLASLSLYHIYKEVTNIKKSPIPVIKHGGAPSVARFFVKLKLAVMEISLSS